MKLYGSIDNRICEGKNYNDDKQIHVGDDITMYYWSDRSCYYVTEVIDQKRIKVKQYEVVADRTKKGGMGHQNWMYFKSKKEASEYLKSFGLDGYSIETENEEETWVFRYGKWREEVNVDGKKKYYDLSGKVSFGVRDYHYDWEF